MCALHGKIRMDSRQEEYVEAMVHQGHTEEGACSQF